MNEKQIEQHVPILGVLHLVGGAMTALIGVSVFLFLSALGVAVQDEVAPRILGLIGIAVGALLVVLSVPSLVAGYGLLKRWSWARGLAIAVGILNLINVPIGTIIGIYTLIVLLSSSAEGYFASPRSAA
jgi:hypothetical protein